MISISDQYFQFGKTAVFQENKQQLPIDHNLLLCNIALLLF